jgi:uncharacterized protein YdhG (YjbR/CyaY superfamily)
MKRSAAARSVSEYLKTAPKAARPKLVQLRAIVKATVPQAEEGISYKMPYYKYHGALVGFAAFKDHIGFFPGSIVKEFKRELEGFETARGSVRFPLDKPLPAALIKKLLKARMKRNEDKKKKSPERT